MVVKSFQDPLKNRAEGAKNIFFFQFVIVAVSYLS